MCGAENKQGQSFAVYRQLPRTVAAHVNSLGEARQVYTSFFQLPAWASLLYAPEDVYFIAGYKNGMLNFFALVNRNGKKYFNIQFGPVCHDAAVWKDALRYLRRLFRYKALCLTVQPDAGMDLFAGVGGSRFTDRYNWSTPVLDIDRPEEEIFAGFSENLRRSIKKAVKNGLEIVPVRTVALADKLAAIYLAMYAGRGLYADEAQVRRLWTGVQERLEEDAYKYGIIFSVQKEGKAIGGILITLCGGRAFYYMGCSDPAERKLPVLHLAFWEAIKYCRSLGIKQFDFGGYDPYAVQGSQVYAINLFKKQFNPVIVHYPERIYFSLVPAGTCLLRLMRKLRS